MFVLRGKRVCLDKHVWQANSYPHRGTRGSMGLHLWIFVVLQYFLVEALLGACDDIQNGRQDSPHLSFYKKNIAIIKNS